MRGGERVVEALCELYPEADVFTHVAKPDALSDTIRRHRIQETFIARLARRAPALSEVPAPDAARPGAAGPSRLRPRHQQRMRSGEGRDHHPANPARVLLPQSHALRVGHVLGLLAKTCRGPMRPAARVLLHYLRRWDLASAFRVDHFIANSEFVARRVRKHYRRDSEVIHPSGGH